MKHIEVNYHFVWDQVMKRLIDVWLISTHNQVADGFTKMLLQQKFQEFSRNLNLDKSWLKGGVGAHSVIVLFHVNPPQQIAFFMAKVYRVPYCYAHDPICYDCNLL
jgi:hypothetical protein